MSSASAFGAVLDLPDFDAAGRDRWERCAGGELLAVIEAHQLGRARTTFYTAYVLVDGKWWDVGAHRDAHDAVARAEATLTVPATERTWALSPTAVQQRRVHRRGR
ncbi:hypothetical protein [Microbacterium immunditiarum]|uniref:Uncharacterized protein n=1 Tax=Microbacterium immunditiarum TaxID=337480 RepID=A0A7Y9GKH9_9MICO|nr:hypothetical protein [Microbacterium immunditiarum]NYE18117.1 hypothetical protein [Microbacterium immunditiarum]